MLQKLALQSKKYSSEIFDRFRSIEKENTEEKYDYPHTSSLPYSESQIAAAIVSTAIWRMRELELDLDKSRFVDVFKPMFLSLSRYQNSPDLQIVNFCTKNLDARNRHHDLYSDLLASVAKKSRQLEQAWEKCLEQPNSDLIFLPRSLESRLPFMSSETSLEIIHIFASLRAEGLVSEQDLKEGLSSIDRESLSPIYFKDPILATVTAFAWASYNLERGFVKGLDRDWMNSAPFIFCEVPASLTLRAYGGVSPEELSRKIGYFDEGQFYLHYWWNLYDAIQIRIETSNSSEPESEIEVTIDSKAASGSDSMPEVAEVQEDLGTFEQKSSDYKLPWSFYVGMGLVFGIPGLLLIAANCWLLSKVVTAHIVVLVVLATAFALIEFFIFCCLWTSKDN